MNFLYFAEFSADEFVKISSVFCLGGVFISKVVGLLCFLRFHLHLRFHLLFHLRLLTLVLTLALTLTLTLTLVLTLALACSYIINLVKMSEHNNAFLNHYI